jgi:Bifunctional DNA primase/polymerase, N-terminal/AAA domain
MAELRPGYEFRYWLNDPWVRTDLLSGALEMAARGWAVFPCNADSEPMTKHGHKDATTDPAAIRTMFARSGVAKIGIATGQVSGLCVVDIDVKKGKRGDLWYDENEPRLPQTRLHETQSGGMHMIFRRPDVAGMQCSVEAIADGIDVKTDGGYIIAPPSPGYSILDDAELAEMPAWLAQVCLEAPAKLKAEKAAKRETERVASQPLASHLSRPSDEHLSKYAARALELEVAAMTSVREGGRNNQLNLSAHALGTIVGAGMLSRATVESQLTAAALGAGLDRSAIDKTIRSGLDAGIAKPRDLSGVGTLSTALSATATAEAVPETEADALLDAMCAYTWAALDIPPEPRLLGDFITATSRVFIVGSTGLGKTQLAHGMAAGIASGSGFLHWKADHAARVLIVDGEMPTALIKERIGSALLRTSSKIEARNLVIYGLDRSEVFAEQSPALGHFEPLNTKEGQDFMLRLIDVVNPEAIIFDNVMSLITGDQKDEVPWSETLPLVSKISKLGIGQVWLDHTGHNRTRQYGSATKAWRFDAVGIMSAVDGAEEEAVTFMLSFDDPGKARRRTPANWGDFAPHLITLTGDAWTSERVGMAKGKSKGSASKETTKRVAMADLALETLGEVIAERGYELKGQPKIPHGTTVTTLEEWRTAVFDGGIVGDDDTDAARRQQFKRIKDDLLKARKIGIHQKWIWLVSNEN